MAHKYALVADSHLNSLLAYLSPWSYCPPLLHTAHWPHRRLVGPHHPEPPRPRRHVLVLFPVRPGRPNLVERMDYSITDCTICH